MRSHPPSLIRRTSRCLEDECGVSLRGSKERILVAVSGGPDSMALLHVLHVLSERGGPAVVACGVDHGLRPEAGDELELAQGFATSRGVAFVTERVQVPAGSNLQARARQARYDVLERVAEEWGAAFIATAHHADDRAETVLLRLLRGSGPRGLAVLPPRNGRVLRPFVRAGRADIDAHLVRHRIPFASDPSNRDPRFQRTRVRVELVPLLRELSPGIVGHLNALADQLGDCEALTSGPEYAAVLDDVGAEVRLNREQARQLRQALERGEKTFRLPLGAGRELVVDERGEPRIR